MKMFAVTNGMFKIEAIRVNLNKNKDLFVQATHYPVVCTGHTLSSSLTL
jgi:hypothetical protein